MISPLNPLLYRSLHRISSGQVAIANPGQSAVIAQVWRDGRRRPYVTTWGETYRVPCWACAAKGNPDGGRHLHFGHRYGVRDLDGNDYRFLVKCFRCESQSDPVWRKQFFDRVYGLHSQPYLISAQQSPAAELGPIDWPGCCVSLADLGEGHPANQYLRQRGFDPLPLTNHYDVRLCAIANAECMAAANRIVAPVYRNGQLFWWLARAIGEAPPGSPRYLCAKGSGRKSQVLYAYDRAKRHPVVVLVEGVADAWAVGDLAVAIFGKEPSQYQLDLIRQTWKAAIIMMDDAKAYQTSAPQWIYLQRAMPTVQVDLTGGPDPADSDPAELADLVESALHHLGYDPELLGASG